MLVVEYVGFGGVGLPGCRRGVLMGEWGGGDVVCGVAVRTEGGREVGTGTGTGKWESGRGGVNE